MDFYAQMINNAWARAKADAYEIALQTIQPGVPLDELTQRCQIREYPCNIEELWLDNKPVLRLCRLDDGTFSPEVEQTWLWGN